MILDVFNKSFIRIANINKYSYAQYTDELNGAGKFTVKVPITDQILEYLQEGKYILFEKEVLGEITRITVDENEESDKMEITLTGKLAKRFLSFRCFIKTANYSGTVTDVLRKFITDNFISPSDTVRSFSGFKLSDNATYIPTTDKITLQVTGGSVEDEIETLCDTYEMGYDLVPVLQTVKNGNVVTTNILGLEFRVIKGKDRSVGNTAGNSPVQFSFKMKNLTESKYDRDESAYKTMAYVAGEGDGTARTVISTGDTTSTGVNRKELYVDARDVQSTDENGNNLIAADYAKALQERGDSSLAENKVSETFTCNINQYKTQFAYGKEYYKGDIVTVYDTKTKITVNARVTGVTFTSMGNRDMLDVTFGYEKLTHAQKLKRGGILNG